MKKTKIDSKLALQKETLTKLEVSQMNSVNGGNKSTFTYTIVFTSTSSLFSSICK